MRENILKEGLANLQKNIESVGGKLSLTEEKLIFKTHQFNVQTGVTEIELSNIQHIDKCFTKFLGIIPLFPNSIAVSTNESTYRFVVNGRNKWIQSINQARNV